MNINEYLVESERTEKKFPNGMLLKNADLVRANIALVIAGCMMADALKKEAIYGKPLSVGVEDAAADIFQGIYQQIDGLFDSEEFVLTQEKAELFHALIGLITELGELGLALTNHIFGNKPIDRVNVGEELADFDWYRAIILRLLKIDENVIRENNIAKLRKRYPDKFTEKDALNRNTEEERRQLEMNF